MLSPSAHVLGAAGGAAWAPTDLGSKLSVWYDANDAATITQSSGAVSQWNDKSGNANHGLQATGAKQPTYSATSWRGTKPGISFDGSADSISLTTAVSYSGGVGIWAFVALNNSGAATDRVVLSAPQSGAPFLRLNSAGNTIDLNRNNEAGIQTGVACASGYRNVGFEASSNLSAISVDGTRTTQTAADPAFSQPFYLIGESPYFDSQIAEVLIGTGILTSGERTSINNYLTAKWA